jgi:tetratricopeptide (TPR) repeat protein
MPTWIRLLVLPLVAFSVPTVLAARTTVSLQSGNTRRAIDDLNVYRALIIEFRKGNDDIVAELLTWEQKRLRTAIALIDTPFDPMKPWPADLSRSATIMHTDAAIRCLDDKAVEAVFFHLLIARDHLQRGGRELDSFASRWVFAVSRFMRSRGRILEAERLLEVGRGIVPADPVVLYESGLLQEMFATHWETAAPGIATRTTQDIARRDPLDAVLKNRPARLDRAEHWLRASLRSNPSNVMARLHLGRVQMMRRANDEALELLRGVLDSTTDRATAYLAAMFTGALHEREGHPTEAVLAYRQAIDRFGQGHSAYLALSEVLQRAGRGDESRAVLLGVLTEDPHTRREPWSWYFIEPPDIARERLEAVRREGRR